MVFLFWPRPHHCINDLSGQDSASGIARIDHGLSFIRLDTLSEPSNAPHATTSSNEVLCKSRSGPKTSEPILNLLLNQLNIDGPS